MPDSVCDATVAFESGRQKSFCGDFESDGNWLVFRKEDGGTLHVNKSKIEWIETFPGEEQQEDEKAQAIGFVIPPPCPCESEEDGDDRSTSLG